MREPPPPRGNIAAGAFGPVARETRKGKRRLKKRDCVPHPKGNIASRLSGVITESGERDRQRDGKRELAPTPGEYRGSILLGGNPENAVPRGYRQRRFDATGWEADRQILEPEPLSLSPVTDADHYRKLEHLYVAAPISRWYGISIAISDGKRRGPTPGPSRVLPRGECGTRLGVLSCAG